MTMSNIVDTCHPKDPDYPGCKRRIISLNDGEVQLNMKEISTWFQWWLEQTAKKKHKSFNFSCGNPDISPIFTILNARKWGTLHPVPSVQGTGHLLRSEFRMFFGYREATVSLVATFEWETFKICWPSNINQSLGFLVNLLATHRNHGVTGSWTRKILQDNEARCEVCLERLPRPVSFSSWESKVTTQKMPPTQKIPGRLFKGVSPKSGKIISPFSTFFHNMGSN